MSFEQQIEELIRGPQYTAPQAEKESRLLAILRAVCQDVAGRCPPYARFLARLGTPAETWQRLADVPPLPAAAFKHLPLVAVAADKIVRERARRAPPARPPAGS